MAVLATGLSRNGYRHWFQYSQEVVTLRMTKGGRQCFDALVIGAGFYGSEIALELSRLSFERILLVERESGILRRASYVNQARVHNGYHYPRALVTAQRSRANFMPFVTEYADAIDFDIESVYAIARGSRVSPAQFETFCRTVGIPYRPAPRRIAQLLDTSLIDETFITRELCFDAVRLAVQLMRNLRAANIELMLNSEARVLGWDHRGVDVVVNSAAVRADYVFNCTYGALASVGIPISAPLKKELTEMLLIEPPPDLRNLGITVMDGPFFSTLPFPAAKLHSLSHVRYTPHEATIDTRSDMLQPSKSNREAMLRDAARYLPCLSGTHVVRSIFEIKAVLVNAEADDARPILIEQSADMPRVISILGSKIDNIYEVRSFLRAQRWRTAA
jgi:glycine/D-amino acid oxidase-like deaminating enzyme